MDYLDPKKEARHRLVILVGYACIAVAITIATLVLLYQANGFGVGRNGDVIQNGLLYVSSQPATAKISLNGKPDKGTTNTRLLLPANIYDLKLTREGYRDWQRAINLEGGRVARFDYPFLFPKELATESVANYSAAPGLATQSPDRRWLVFQTPGSMTNFQVNDLKNPTTVTTQINLPPALLTKAVKSESWQLGEWSSDNKHLILKHIYDDKSEFILIDREEANRSLNLNVTLASAPTDIKLKDKKFDQYYLHFAAGGKLQTASISQPAAQPVLNDVLTYQSYGSKTILYITSDGAPEGKVLLKMLVGDQTYILRDFLVGSGYLVNFTEYDDALYVAAGAIDQDRVYIYKDPIAQLKRQPDHALTPVQVLRVAKPNRLSFSNSAQFIAVENGQQFGVYDIFNKVGHNYSTSLPLDAPQVYATWMDGNRLTYISGGKTVVVDYDGNNLQELMPSNPNYVPFFGPSYKYVYSLDLPLADKKINLTQTSLLTKADQ